MQAVNLKYILYFKLTEYLSLDTQIQIFHYVYKKLSSFLRDNSVI